MVKKNIALLIAFGVVVASMATGCSSETIDNETTEATTESVSDTETETESETESEYNKILTNLTELTLTELTVTVSTDEEDSEDAEESDNLLEQDVVYQDSLLLSDIEESVTQYKNESEDGLLDVTFALKEYSTEESTEEPDYYTIEGIDLTDVADGELYIEDEQIYIVYTSISTGEEMDTRDLEYFNSDAESDEDDADDADSIDDDNSVSSAGSSNNSSSQKSKSSNKSSNSSSSSSSNDDSDDSDNSGSSNDDSGNDSDSGSDSGNDAGSDSDDGSQIDVDPNDGCLSDGGLFY